MAGPKLEKTRWPGIYRRGARWAYEWTDADDKRRRGTASHPRGASAPEGRGGSQGRPRRNSGMPAHAFGSPVARYALDLFGADLERPNDQKPARGRYAGPASWLCRSSSHPGAVDSNRSNVGSLRAH